MKSTLGFLYPRATLCYNRIEGDYEPCGECAVCKGEDTSNISHYTINNSTTSWEPVRKLIEQSKQLPTVNFKDIRPDQFYRFIILNEIQQASPELLALLYDALEFCPSTTIFILISMDVDKLKAKNPQMAEAITSRVAELHLPSFADEVIANHLVYKIDGLNLEAAMAIAKLSNGSMRKSIQNYANFLALVDDPIELTEELVLCSRSGGATKESRLAMWTALGQGDGATVKEIVSYWSSNASDIKLVGTLLQNDVIENLNNPSVEVQSLLASLGRWYTGLNYPLVTVLMSHLGTNIIQFPTPSEREIRKQSKQQIILPVSSLSIAEQVAQQTIKATSNTFQLPAILVTTSYKELMLHYDRN